MQNVKSSPLAGQTVKIKDEANEIGGEEFRVEDYWKVVSGGVSWMDANGNPACMNYAMRSGFSKEIQIPIDNKVLYGKIGSFGFLVHESEIES